MPDRFLFNPYHINKNKYQKNREIIIETVKKCRKNHSKKVHKQVDVSFDVFDIFFKHPVKENEVQRQGQKAVGKTYRQEIVVEPFPEVNVHMVGIH